MEIEKELSDNQVLLVVMENLNYSKSVMGITKKLSGKNVCFATLNKTYPAIEEWLKKNKVDAKNFVFIEAVSRIIKNAQSEHDKFRFVSSPSALTELSIAISETAQKGIDYLVFDSVSTLLIYNSPKKVEMFLSGIVNKIRSFKTKGIFLILKNDKLIQSCSMFVDNVLELGENEK
jgi:KaiC/GvpD/RAD55 family RecA-like ATPase